MVSPICTGNESTSLVLIGQVQRCFENFVIHQRLFFLRIQSVALSRYLFFKKALSQNWQKTEG